MKNFFKIFFTLVLFGATSTLMAQQVGIKAGLNLSTMKLKDDQGDLTDDFKIKPGFHLGLVADIPANKVLSFETGLLLSTKGLKEVIEGEFNGSKYTVTTKINLIYLEVPLTFKASIDLGGAKLYALAGPSVGIGIHGKVKAEMSSNGESDSDEADIEWGSEDSDNFKRMDIGLIFGAGFQFDNVLIGASYNLGLNNNATNQDNGLVSKNRVIGISVGYMFGK